MRLRGGINEAEFAALETVASDTMDKGRELGSPGYGAPSAVTLGLQRDGLIEFVTNDADGLYRARLTSAGRHIIECAR